MTYEPYNPPADPFIDEATFAALDSNGKGEAIMHLVHHNEEGKQYALKLLDDLSDADAAVVLVICANEAKRYFPPANPQAGEMPEGMENITPQRPTMRMAVPAPGAGK